MRAASQLLGHKKPGDFRDDVVLRAYQALLAHYYLRDRTVLGVFRTKMRYAGPQDIFRHFPDLGIVPLFFTAFFYCRKCGGAINEKTCPHDASARVEFSGTRLRGALASGSASAIDLIRPEVASVVREWPHPFIASGAAASEGAS